MKLFSAAGQLFGALVLPQACVLCGRLCCRKGIFPLCRTCQSGLRPLHGPTCCICGDLVPGPIGGHPRICQMCRRRPPGFDRGLAWGPYRGDLRHLLRQFKYGRNPRLWRPLSRLLREAWSREKLDLPDGLVPVPSHPKRVLQRGFDPARLLASGLSEELGVPLLAGVRRVRSTAPQFGLDEKQRMTNLQGAFAVDPGISMEGKSLLVVDDILTTGTTTGELAQVLRRRGASRIMVLVVARALRHS